jgi:hypothetical protein
MERAIRVIRNRSRVGKPWLLVLGRYETIDRVNGGRRRWRTELQISEHRTESQAREAKKEYAP